MTYATNRGDVAQVGHLLNVKNHINHPYSYHERGVPQYFSFYCHFAYSIHPGKKGTLRFPFHAMLCQIGQ